MSRLILIVSLFIDRYTGFWDAMVGKEIDLTPTQNDVGRTGAFIGQG